MRAGAHSRGGATTNAQVRAVVLVGAILVALNLFLTFSASHDHGKLPKSVREAQAGAARALGSDSSAATAGVGAGGSWGWWGNGAGSGTRAAAPRVAAAAAPKVRPSASSPPPPPPESFLTNEHCYAQSDESETCFYHGPLCYDGDKLVVSTEHEHGQDVRTSMCYDFRHFVASPSCGYNGPHKRESLPPTTSLPELQDDGPRSLSYSSPRKWGPLGREVHYKEVRASVFRDPEAANVTMEWLDGPMYVGGLHHSWLDHTWHFTAAAMPLFDLKRYNRSEHIDDGGHGAISSLHPMGGWEAPPMDYLLIAGEYRNVKSSADLRPWIGHLLSLLVQNHTQTLWNSVWKNQMGVGPQHWVCSRQSVVFGLKPRFFNSIGDAHVWRMLAYQYAGVSAPTKDEWPPRRITLITRTTSRNIINIDEVVAFLRATGIELNWISDMGALTFQEQVSAMANTGVLLAIHGAGLANVMFMPAHSVVVEITPYLLYASMYRDLAASAGLYYYRLPSLKPDNVSSPQFYEKDFYDKCDGDERHISSPAAFLDYECNSRSKSSSVLLSMQRLADVLELALDDIGCRDSYCHQITGWGYDNKKKEAAAAAAAAAAGVK